MLTLLFLAAAIATPAPPPPELSTIVVPIHTSLAPLLPQLEAQVPKNLAKLDAYELDPKQEFGMKYRVARDPIALNVIGSGIHAMTTVHYALEGCRRTQKPFTDQIVMWPCVSCGFGEPMRDAWISLTSRLDWDANWRLRSTTRAQPVDFSSNRCTVTFARIDVTDWKIAPIVNDQLRQAMKTIDANTPKLTNIRPAAQQVWSALQAPVLIGPRTWLVMDPADVALGPISGSGLTLTSMLTLRARTRVVVGEQPAVVPKPLPALRVSQAANNGIRIPFDVEVPYAEANRLMTENYANRTYEGVAVTSIRLGPGPAPDGRVSIELNVNYRASLLRRYSGLVYLEGTPLYDPATRTVTLQNLDYSLDPRRKNPFVRIADRVAHEKLRTSLARSAHWSVAPQIDSIRTEIMRAMTRPLAPGVMMRGRVDTIEPGSVVLDPNGIVLHVLATGSAEVEMARCGESINCHPEPPERSAGRSKDPPAANPDVQRLAAGGPSASSTPAGVSAPQDDRGRCGAAPRHSGMTMLDHGILRTAMTFSSTASCVAVAPRTRWMYCTSGETSGRCISRIADFLMLLSETVTFGARFGFNTFVIQKLLVWG